jgi:sugar/nucleoside kinase (ribokinase family)
MHSFDLVTIGNYTKDTIISPAGTRHVDGGGFRYSAHAAALTGLSVAAVTHLAEADASSLDALRAAGITVRAMVSKHSTLMELNYPGHDPDERVLTVAALGDSFTVSELADLQARATLVSASVRGEAPLEVMEYLSAQDGLLAADVQGFVRVVGAGGVLEYAAWPEQAQVLGLLDVLKTDAVEAQFLTGESDHHAAARALAAQGPREVVLTHRDGLVVLADGEFHEASFHPRAMVGRSGRGDTCVGSYLARRLSAGPAEAMRWAAALTSRKLEREGVVRCSLAEVESLLEERYS